MLEGYAFRGKEIFAKLGECSKCKERKERALLMVCSRCRILQYCSKECQIADLPRHRIYCDQSVLANEHHTTKNNKEASS